jgi:hypothetical protein
MFLLKLITNYVHEYIAQRQIQEVANYVKMIDFSSITDEQLCIYISSFLVMYWTFSNGFKDVVSC